MTNVSEMIAKKKKKYFVKMKINVLVILHMYLPTIFRESLVPIVIPKFLSLAFSNPGTTAFKAVNACMACSRPSISAFVRSSTFVQSYLELYISAWSIQLQSLTVLS